MCTITNLSPPGVAGSVYTLLQLAKAPDSISSNKYSFLHQTIIPMRLKKTIRLMPYERRNIERAIMYIDQNYRDRLSADQLSVECNISKQKLQAGFQEMTGMTVHSYILKVRVEKAKQMLADTDKPVKSIAAAMGFKRPSHFIFTFKEFTSQTPCEYRVSCA